MTAAQVYIELNALSNELTDERLIEARDKVDSAMLIVWSLMTDEERAELNRVLPVYVEGVDGD